jgi:hypothetical protein
MLTTIPPTLQTILHNTASRRPPHLSYTQQHTTTLHNSTRVHKTTNVPVVFMAQYIMILRGATSLRGALEGVALKIKTFLGPEMARAKRVPFGPKKVEIIMYRAIKTTGTLIVIIFCTVTVYVTRYNPAESVSNSNEVMRYNYRQSC